MGDAMEMAMDDAETDQNADEVYRQVCDEAGIGMQFEGAATGQISADKQIKSEEVDDLQKRLDNLNM